MQEKREHIDKFSLFLAVIASVIGLGHIWRFPYLLGSNGGSVFLVLYLIAVFILGVPLIFFEMYLGQKHKTTVLCLFRNLFKRKIVLLIPALFLIVVFFILTYYSVITSWTLGYALMAPFGFHSFSSYFGSALMFVAFFLTLFFLYLVVKFGLNKGIDKANRYVSVLFVLFLIVLFGYACTSPGFTAAIRYLFSFDFSMINYRVVVFAFAHALFSLSLGFGILLTYSSYSSKENLNPTIYGVVGLNIIISLIMGVIVYSYLYSFGLSETAGPKLIFEVLPLIFAGLPILGLIFFLLVFFAGFTSAISMFELIISSLKDYFGINREKLDRLFILLLALFCLLPLLCYDSIEVLDTIFGSYLTIFCAAIFLIPFVFFTKEFSFLKRRIYKLYRLLFYLDILILVILFVVSFFLM